VRHKRCKVHSEAAPDLVGGAIGVEGMVGEGVSTGEVVGFRARSGGATEEGYDAARRRVVLFDGYTGSLNPVFSDTWEWDGSTWVQRTPNTVRSGRAGHALAYDSARGRVVLFGGFPQARTSRSPTRGSATETTGACELSQ
jgi:hypothetical protein